MLAGIFVGGQARRMGGRAKGLLVAPSGEPIALRTACVLREAGLEPVLVGDARAYASLGLPAIDDAVAGIGPLGALIALLRRAIEDARDAHASRPGAAQVIALACDMPLVTASLVRSLVRSSSDAAIVAPRLDGRWQPLFARYDAARVLPFAERHATEGVLSLQRLLDACAAAELSVAEDDARALDDWDTPDDVSSLR